jgi:hypothetical protein
MKQECLDLHIRIVSESSDPSLPQYHYGWRRHVMQKERKLDFIWKSSVCQSFNLLLTGFSPDLQIVEIARKETWNVEEITSEFL